MNKLVAYHESEHADIHRWNSKLALVKLSGWCITLVPFDGADESVPDGDPSEFVRSGVSVLLETTQSAMGLIAFGELSKWANRRMSERRSHRCHEIDCDHHIDEWRPDFQRVFGHIFNRQVIRESMQWLYQQSVHRDAPVDVRVVPHGPPTNGKTNHVLVMRCGEWTAIIMCCSHSTQVISNDPLFPEAQ